MDYVLEILEIIVSRFYCLRHIEIYGKESVIHTYCCRWRWHRGNHKIIVDQMFYHDDFFKEDDE